VIADELHVKPASTGSSTSIFPGSSGCIKADTGQAPPLHVLLLVISVHLSLKCACW
jgi:hypothetical protein